MNLKTQRNILAVAVVVLLIVLGVLAGTGALSGAAGGQGKGKGQGKDEKTGKDIVTSDEELAVNPLNPGTSVVGLNKIVPGLNIATSAGNDVIYLSSLSPEVAAYGANEVQPDGSIVENVVNGCTIPGGAIADVGSGTYGWSTKKHEYQFNFEGGKTVRSFQIGVLDWGDFLQWQAQNGKAANGTHTIVMEAYNANGEVVSTTEYTFTTNANSKAPFFLRSSAQFPNPTYTPRYSAQLENAGRNMKIYGDACEAPLGTPGKLILKVQGTGITRVQVHFKDQNSMDSHIALWLGAMEIKYDECYNFLALSNNDKKAFDFSGTASVAFCGGGAYSNSGAESSNNSIPTTYSGNDFYGTACKAPNFASTGEWVKPENLASFGLKNNTGVAITDPIAGTAAPANPGNCEANGDLTEGDIVISGPTCYVSIKNLPGQTLNITGDPARTDNILYLSGSPNGASVKGSFSARNIMIYSVGDFDMNSESGSVLEPMASGPWHGFMLWSNGKDIRLNGSSDSNWTGTIYGPTSHIVINGGSDTVLRTTVIGLTIDFAGNNNTVSYCDPYVNFVSVP